MCNYPRVRKGLGIRQCMRLGLQGMALRGLAASRLLLPGCGCSRLLQMRLLHELLLVLHDHDLLGHGSLRLAPPYSAHAHLRHVGAAREEGAALQRQLRLPARRRCLLHGPHGLHLLHLQVLHHDRLLLLCVAVQPQVQRLRPDLRRLQPWRRLQHWWQRARLLLQLLTCSLGSSLRMRQLLRHPAIPGRRSTATTQGAHAIHLLRQSPLPHLHLLPGLLGYAHTMI